MLQYFWADVEWQRRVRGDRRQMGTRSGTSRVCSSWVAGRASFSRLEAAGQEAAAAECGEVLRELQAVEKAEMASVVRGENYHTIWSVGG